MTYRGIEIIIEDDGRWFVHPEDGTGKLVEVRDSAAAIRFIDAMLG